jgi:hypothetical protein
MFKKADISDCRGDVLKRRYLRLLGRCFKKTISPTVVEAVPEGGMFITSGILILVLRALYIQILAYCTYIGIL